MYEDSKFRNIKEKLVEKLNERELEDGEYWQMVYQLLLNEGIVKGSYKNAAAEVTVRLAVRLLPKLPAEEHWGLEKKYIALKGRKLSTEVQEDLRKYSELERMTHDYLKKELGNKLIFRSQFETMIEKYLMNQTDLPNMASKRKQREAAIRISTVLELTTREFNVQRDPMKKIKKIGNYDIKILENAVDKL